MAFARSFVLVALPGAIAACGGSSSQPKPEGTHYHYVANKLYVPTSTPQSREYGLDLNGDGQPDNRLGQVLGTLSGLGFDITGTIDSSVAEGSINLLVDFQTKDFMNTSAAGLQVLLGANPVPAACNTGESYMCNMAMPPVCSGCGHQLTGTGMFSIAPNSPSNAALAGKVASGTFTGGPGALALQIALGGTMAIELDLIGARAKMTGASETAIGSANSGGLILAGALTQDDIMNKVIPSVQSQITAVILRDCCGAATSPGGATCNPLSTGMNPNCGCKASSTGSEILGQFDGKLMGQVPDCTISQDELTMSPTITSLLAPDVTIDSKPALSLGVKVTAVGATFTAPTRTADDGDETEAEAPAASTN
jgi:hypothetical protein